MAVYGGPDIVTDGLVLHLDAGNSKSYPGSGNTWFDLSSNNNNGVISGSIYSSDNNGSFNFDGNDKITSTNNSSLQITIGTIGAWFKATNTNTGVHGIIAKQSAWGLFVWGNTLRAYSWGSPAAVRSTTKVVGDNIWHYAAMTFAETMGNPSNNATIYLDGINVLTTTIKHSAHNVTVQIGEANASQFFRGNIAQASVYNRVLSSTEILQNYNALKGRFGL